MNRGAWKSSLPLDSSRRAYGSQHDRTRQMQGKRAAAEEGRKLFNPLREAYAKLEVIIHSDDATIHFVGRVAFVSKEEALRQRHDGIVRDVSGLASPQSASRARELFDR